MQRTRRQILDILKRRGRATLEDLAREVGLSPVTVRVHLSVLQRDDLVSVEEVRGRIGRPYFVYSLTEEAEDLFPKRYHVLANRLLSTMDEALPSEAVTQVMGKLAESWAAEKSSRLDGKDLSQRVAEVTQIRSEEGAIADWQESDGGYVITQFNCANLMVSRVHHRVCEMEEQYISLMLGIPVERQSCIGRGDRMCAYFVKRP